MLRISKGKVLGDILFFIAGRIIAAVVVGIGVLTGRSITLICGWLLGLLIRLSIVHRRLLCVLLTVIHGRLLLILLTIINRRLLYILIAILLIVSLSAA